ncbi:THUMP domain-containing protein [Propionivibrio sp.]|uniref:THUMP domain-containing class I SAM-dependent RNA methyltransferase n=1 Tax=Propionivibrio sp. TaxID=2212460 RepID=UPI0025CFEAC6|nr:THUMP domain-containing protein [Propionivibrio sp.]MBK8402423.1 class I SAM-dependent RNA methyltransferase [Propionivibrio sp.]MBK8743577.1 class I SAM-dependent RNA methyltransferase [Propionivibrio sp.]MBL0206456.1 class I SAM-dependent RNA methyltransferase [Propionivibrio sp.]
MENFFASCPRGLEPLLVEDLSAAGVAHAKQIPGGVHFSADWPACYSANLHSRIATRILWQVSRGPYLKEDDIYRQALAVPWPTWFDAGQTIRVDITALKCPLRSLEFITLRIKDALCDRFRADVGKRPSVDTREPEVRIHGFLSASECTLYIDTSGAPLYQRGLRQKTVEAPLKENVAAGILRFSGWQPGIPLLDPMCGSGTFLLEAAQMALNIAPGAGRDFGFQRLKNFRLLEWKRLLDTAMDAEKPAASAQIYGSDISPVAVRAALANLDRAGLLPAVTLRSGDLLEIDAPAVAGILVTNPPYGERLSEQDELADLYPHLGSALKRKFAGWNCYLLSADMRMPKLMRLTPSKKTPLYNGALECRLFEFKMVAGSNRR